MSGNANTDVRNTRLLSLAGYERVMGGEGMEGGPCLANGHIDCCPKMLLRPAFGWTFAGQQLVLYSSPICVTKIVSSVRAGAH